MIQLEELQEGMPGVSHFYGGYLAEAGAVCLESQGHSSGQIIAICGYQMMNCPVTWPTVTDQIKRTLNDLQEATEFGAAGIAILIAKKLSGHSVLERSRKGTGFDYWIGNEELKPFQNKARLEVSGILRGTLADIDTRLNQKLKQTDKSDYTSLPALVIIVEFSIPQAHMESK